MDLRDLYVLSETLGVKLKDRQWCLALAESCTGGMLAQTLTQVPGSSQWFDCGVVSYSNSAKTKLLTVPENLLQKYGAVSSEVALSMVQGILAVSSAQLALSITGIAGPGGGSAEKPVGLVYIALASASKSEVQELYFQGDRSAVRYQSVHTALQWLVDFCE